MFTLHNGDCLPFMRSLPADSVDAVITDPPYGMGLFEHDIEQWEVVKDIYRLMKPNSIIYMFCGDNSYIKARTELEKYFTYRRTIIWERAIGHGGDDFQLTHEYILYAWKGEPTIIKPTRRATSNASKMLGRSTVGEKTIIRTPSFNSTSAERNGHPTQKPIELLKKLVGTIEGGIILDPFMGSGSTGVAAIELGYGFIGCELSQEYFPIAEKRIKQAALSPNFFTPSNNRVYSDAGDSAAFQADFYTPADTTSQTVTTPTQRM